MSKDFKCDKDYNDITVDLAKAQLVTIVGHNFKGKEDVICAWCGLKVKNWNTISDNTFLQVDLKKGRLNTDNESNR